MSCTLWRTNDAANGCSAPGPAPHARRCGPVAPAGSTVCANGRSSPALGQLCAEERVSITSATLLSIAAVMAEHADHATGRHVAVTRATIASRVGCDVRTITAAWRVLRVSQWAVEAQRGHGSPGTPSIGRRPSVYHLVPRREARPVTRPVVHDFHLPPSGGVSLFFSRRELLTKRARKRARPPNLRQNATSPRHGDAPRGHWPSNGSPLDSSRSRTASTAPTSAPSATHSPPPASTPTCGQHARSTTSSTPTCAPEG